MLRILLIILVALAVIFGLIRLTGAKPGDAAPAGPVEEAVGAAIEADPASDVVVEEPAVDTLDTPVDIVEGAEPEVPEITPEEAASAPPEIPVDPAPTEPENAAPEAAPTSAVAVPAEEPAADPARVPETPQR